MLYWKTRLFAFIALSIMITSCGYISHEGYYIVKDSFVAPFSLGPDNDLVIDNRLKLAQIEMEKAHDISIKESSEAIIYAGNLSLSELESFHFIGKKALAFPTTTVGQQVTSSNIDINKLIQESQTLKTMQQRQETFVAKAKANLEAGVIQRPDYEKEIQAFDQINLASSENDRSKIEMELMQFQAKLGQSSFARKDKNGNPIPTPEIVMNEYQLTLIDNQILSTRAIIQSAEAEEARVTKELANISSLEEKIMSRPIFKAINENQDLAFAPYPSLQGIAPGKKIMDCVWDIFNCREVGKVGNIIPGETILPDIFTGGQVRGQFITLNFNNVSHADSMQSKILRVR